MTDTAIQNSTRTRETWVDWAKALLMLFIVMGHAGLSGIPCDLVYAFHVPAFFMVSGFLYKPHPWQRTLKSFGIPIVLYSAIMLCYVLVKMHSKGETLTALDILTRATPPYWQSDFSGCIILFNGVWFVIVLFFMRLLMGDILRLTFIRNNAVYVLLFLIGYMLLEPLWINRAYPLQNYYAYKVISCMPFILIGYLMKQYKDRLFSLSPLTLFALAVIYVVLTLLNGHIDMWAYGFGRSYMLLLPNAVVASVLFFNLCKLLPKNSIVEVFSKGTLLILGMHTMLLEWCRKACEILHLPILAVVCGITILLLCYYPIRFALKHCPVVLGK